VKLVEVQDPIEAMDAALGRLSREVEILLVALGAEDAALGTDEAVQQDHALGIGGLLDERVVVEREEVHALEVERPRQQLAKQGLEGRETL